MLHAPVSIVFSCLLYVMHLQRYSSTYRGTAVRGGPLRPLCGCQKQTADVPYVDYWHVFVVLSKFYVAMQKAQFQLLHCCTALLIMFYLSNIRLPAVPDFISTPHVELNSTLPTSVGGGVSDTAPSLKRHSSLYIKPSTGDGRELTPPAI